MAVGREAILVVRQLELLEGGEGEERGRQHLDLVVAQRQQGEVLQLAYLRRDLGDHVVREVENVQGGELRDLRRDGAQLVPGHAQDPEVVQLVELFDAAIHQFVAPKIQRGQRRAKQHRNALQGAALEKQVL
eukprot:CAMPEP_0206270878 /NCGR_PEP_ID=MMETSP0047_2-20121206/33110_1 /ASSEMBLY_ACC=CAM_ASM_000192 /TAXON_ID=195065 /ORGANISM="Chroomonas mesostigmatica_cf, Strain CCMP1168" /LENGTH=131 /DNA_ID=CAMNT_0053699563 /DNA_START=133 /DNA_END=528 /DNA_ORIENTATION=-